MSPNHTDVVAAVKADLLARGVALDGECGAFEITRRVAWQLRGEGAGLLDKPTGQNCRGFAADIIAYPDGEIVDMLGASGVDNGPQWLATPPDPSMVPRWRAPSDPGDGVVAPPPPSPAPSPDDAPVTRADLRAAIDELIAAGEANTAAIQTQINQVVKNAEASGKAIGAIVEPLLPALWGQFVSK